MPAQNLARLAAVGSVAMALVPRRFNAPFLLGALLLVAGCAARPPVSVGPDPSDPGARTPRTGYSSTIGRYTSQRPVAPSAWKKQNEQVAPAPKSGG
ncbi:MULTISPECIES: hypothetical protein [unclassified Afipia]|uniref:hypothetical protein n=1 Tax=unclassified Afipia TaxID=2642050 RepID=UPI0003F79F2B|nr:MULTISPECIES: hypothetical protein [unclassified Afipia]